jgi:hypothetical protein
VGIASRVEGLCAGGEAVEGGLADQNDSSGIAGSYAEEFFMIKERFPTRVSPSRHSRESGNLAPCNDCGSSLPAAAGISFPSFAGFPLARE